MFDLYLGLNGETAIGFDRIALLFHADGIPATGRLRDEKNKPLADRVWHAATISQIMANPAYIGDFVWGAEVVTIPTLAIISHEIFDAVLARRAINKSESKRNVKYDYLLRGRLTCTCGRKMKAVKDVFKGHTYLYYQCNRKAFDPSPACDRKRIQAGLADHVVWNWLVDVFRNPERLLAGLRESMLHGNAIKPRHSGRGWLNCRG